MSHRVLAVVVGEAGYESFPETLHDVELNNEAAAAAADFPIYTYVIPDDVDEDDVYNWAIRKLWHENYHYTNTDWRIYRNGSIPKEELNVGYPG